MRKAITNKCPTLDMSKLDEYEVACEAMRGVGVCSLLKGMLRDCGICLTQFNDSATVDCCTFFRFSFSLFGYSTGIFIGLSRTPTGAALPTETYFYLNLKTNVIPYPLCFQHKNA